MNLLATYEANKNRIISVLKKFGELALPLRLLLGTLTGIIAGPGVVGFLSEYATYAYALRIGIRPPLEGIPYLRTAVAAGGLILTLSAVLVFIATRGLLASMANNVIQYLRITAVLENITFYVFHAIFPKKFPKPDVTNHDHVRSFRALSAGRALSLAVLVSATFGVMMLTPRAFDKDAPWMPSVLVFGYVFVVLLTAWKKEAMWTVSVVAVLAFYSVSFYALFNIRCYAYFLRYVGYGGGAPIELVYRGTPQESSDCYLLLRTTHSLICLDKRAETITEVPLANIKNTSYRLSERASNSNVRIPGMDLIQELDNKPDAHDGL